MKSNEGRDPQNRIKNCSTGTVHWASLDRDGDPVCGALSTDRSLFSPSMATVTCERCIARYGADVPGHVDPPRIQEHVARREAERASGAAERRARRNAEKL